MNQPLVSVVIPVHNGASTLLDAVESVRAQNAPLEIIIINDGSTDGTSEVIAALGGSVVAEHLERSGGPAAARNRGIARASAPFVAFIDDDDLWERGRLSLQLSRFERKASIGIVVGLSAFRSFDPSRQEWTIPAPPRLLYSLGAALCRRSLFDQIGRFDESLRFSEDFDWFLRARDAGIEIIVLDDIVQTVRRDGGNITKGMDLADLGLFGTIKRSLDRRRSSAHADD